MRNKTNKMLPWPYNLFAELEYLQNKHIADDEKHLQYNWDSRLLPETLNMLTKNQRICIIQRFEFGKRFKDIGIVLGGLKVNTVSELCNRALISLLKLSGLMIKNETTNYEKLLKLNIYSLSNFLTKAICSDAEDEENVRTTILNWLNVSTEESILHVSELTSKIKDVQSIGEDYGCSCA